MIDKLMKMKKDKEMDPAHKDAKMSAINEMRNLASSMMKDGLGKHMSGLKQVSVAAPNETDLKKGLDKAKSLLDGSEADDNSESPDEEASEEGSDEGEESPQEEEAEVKDMDMSLEEIEEMERILEEKKQKLLRK